LGRLPYGKQDERAAHAVSGSFDVRLQRLRDEEGPGQVAMSQLRRGLSS
jgi:hypothetical protein